MHFQVRIVNTRSGFEAFCASLMLARPLHTCEKWWKNPVSAPQRVSKMFGRTEWLHLDTWGNFSECEEKKKPWERGTAEWHERETERKTLLRRRGASQMLRVRRGALWGCSLSQRKHGAESRKPFGILNSWKNMSKRNFLEQSGFKNASRGPRVGTQTVAGVKNLKNRRETLKVRNNFFYKICLL